ncbi:histidine phosphatase family protein [Micromonospora sonneratiae]|uniref:Histidine phosphatase family protein n=1 Tax=Micromonospora sonneratiae TaxID=1184706 RepID=A0ABW3YDG5_9ACTN
MAQRLLYLVRHGESEDAHTESVDAGLSEIGRQQARCLGGRLRDVPFTAIHHSPVRRAAQTAQLLAGELPGVPVHESELVGDYVPAIPQPGVLHPAYADWFDTLPVAELARGAELAAAAIDRFTAAPETDERELVVTHNFLIGWLVRHCLDAPDWRWIGLNHYNCGLTVIAYRSDRPSSLLSYNDVGHLPSALRGTGMPAHLRI